MSKVFIRTCGGWSRGPDHPSMLARLHAYGSADARLTIGQIIEFDLDYWKSIGNCVSRTWRSPGYGRVWGFSTQDPTCVIVLKDGTRYPQRYFHLFWKPK